MEMSDDKTHVEDPQILSSDSDKNGDGEDEDYDESDGGDDNAQIVSEINTFLVSVSDVKPRLKSTNRVARLLFCVQKQSSDSAESQSKLKSEDKDPPALEVDEDGDLIRPRRGNFSEDMSLFIEYENATSLEQVGLQVWRGALLMADFIIHSSQTFFQDKTILEFGSGTGLSSIVASMYAKEVIATDLDDNDSSILRLIRTNVTHNPKHVRSEFLVKALDFKNLSWSPDLEACIAEADVLLAADVVYHEKITEAFVKTLQKCLSTGKGKSVFIAIEKRYVFTVSELDVVAPMYEAFLELLKSVLGLSRLSNSTEPGMASSLTSTTGESSPESGNEATSNKILSNVSGTTRLSISPVHIDFPQYFNYERTKELVLWHIRSEKP